MTCTDYKKNNGKLCQSHYERAFTIFHSDGALTREAGGEGGLASPGTSAEAWLHLPVRGGKLPWDACLEKGQQTPLLVPADSTADCVGRHRSSLAGGNSCLNAWVVLHLSVRCGLAGKRALGGC